MTEVLYSISVHTGTLPASGTDADVFITIFGEQGDSCKRKLRQLNFESGQVSTDLFSLHLCLTCFILLLSSNSIFLFNYQIQPLMLHRANL